MPSLFLFVTTLLLLTYLYVFFMEQYRFIFKRQQRQHLTSAVAIVFCGIILTALCTMLLYSLLISNEEQNQAMYASASVFSFIFPCGVMYFRKRICQKFNRVVLFLLLSAAMSVPMVWIIARNTFTSFVFGSILAFVIFTLSLWWGLKVKKFLSFRGLCHLTFVCVAVSSLIEFCRGLFAPEYLKMHVTFCVVALIFGLYNAHDVLRFRKGLPEFTGFTQKEIRETVLETAIQLYINFIGTFFIVDFMKFIVKVFAVQSLQKSAS